MQWDSWVAVRQLDAGDKLNGSEVAGCRQLEQLDDSKTAGCNEATGCRGQLGVAGKLDVVGLLMLL